MTIKQRAVLFFSVGLLIGSAWAFQIGSAMRADRPGFAIIGLIGAGIAVYCCAVNWSIIWRRQS